MSALSSSSWACLLQAFLIWKYLDHSAAVADKKSLQADAVLATATRECSTRNTGEESKDVPLISRSGCRRGERLNAPGNAE